MTTPTLADRPASDATARVARGWARAALASADPSPRSLWVVAPLAAGWAAIIGLVVAAIPVFVMWISTVDSSGSWLDPLRTAGVLWLAGHGVALEVGSAAYSLLPWGLCAIWLALLIHAGKWAARAARVDTLRDGGILIGSAGFLYAVIATVVSVLSATSEIRTVPVRAFGFTLVIALIGLTYGVVRGAGLVPAIRALVPKPVWTALLGATTAVTALIGFGALVAAVALVIGFSSALDIAKFLDAGVLGGLALLLLGIGYLPVAIMWSISYLVGAGITIGPGVLLSPFIAVSTPTQLPPFPLLAALPQHAGPISWALPLLAVAAGAVAGLVIARRGEPSMLNRLGISVGSVAIAVLVTAVLSRLSYGSLGDVRLVGLGPSSQVVALLTGGLLIIGTVPCALIFGRIKTKEGEDA